MVVRPLVARGRSSSMKMQNKIALVTGAALGYRYGGPSIGSAIAFKLASEGARVVVVDILEETGEGTLPTESERMEAPVCLSEPMCPKQMRSKEP